MTSQKQIVPVYAGIVAGHRCFYVAVSGINQIRTAAIAKEGEATAPLARWLKNYAKKEKVKFVAVGLAGFTENREFGGELWLKLDIVPHFYKTAKMKAVNYCRFICHKTAACYDRKNHVRVGLGHYRLVKVSYLSGLSSYKDFATDKEFKNLLDLAGEFKRRKLKMAFFNATAAGGGVAIMRHALVRLYKLLGAEVTWHVMKPDAEIFHITKKKFHNVLHGVADPNIILTAADKEVYNNWISENVKIFQEVFRQSDVIVIDDPQPAGLIPHIKRISPETAIIYRSHIQISSELISRAHKQQFTTWNFLWQFIKLADRFISHPVPAFVPPTVNRRKLVYMPATTDPLDGLNKTMPPEQMRYYRNLFNEKLNNAGQTHLHPGRPYIIQIARFDPSKGIPDVIESYRKLRSRLEKHGVTRDRTPQLVVAGNGSVDDPEGAPIYEETRRMLAMDTYAGLAHDIKIARLAHNDQLLNAVLSESLFAFQLSYKEGFEVKVTEAIMKGKPVIAYRSGGIPLQIRHGQTGYLAKTGSTSQVADYAFRLVTDRKLYRAMSREAAATVNHDYWTINNAAKWLSLALRLAKKK